MEEKQSMIEYQMQLDELKMNTALVFESIEFQTKVMKKQYNEALKQGFSEEQALKIAIEKN
ncbi:hypothetical protein A2G24_01085 [Listeria monocytogenes]|uniref:Uncharacterized protein n=1 Tax=Listeria monocytogenes TaxID=1639 RepID=A0A823DK62_LISMN|nr:hypothetical protein [Listeria monocytogenes]EAD1012221.1 hypothetical protein [Listeria monocytogenes]EAD1186128.1 hypothetical protein [Listeria monocytogenes]EAF8898046.1 hypothetical protein [Listeria monocytogenes]